MLYNLGVRFAAGAPYTSVGDILVAVNPFRWLDLYGAEARGLVVVLDRSIDRSNSLDYA